ncbi:hypothetical protein [uncultured Arthrobacter sp.]|nr:hypothetical protein [uncultured Arthrobacter sp.]
MSFSREQHRRLTTEQKECLVDAIDADLQENYQEVASVDRWWRD